MTSRVRPLVAMVLAAALVLAPAAGASAHFNDVDEDAVYRPHVQLLAAFEITDGIGEGAYGPDEPLTRQQFAVFLVRTLQRTAGAHALKDRRSDFADDADIADWARGHVLAAAASAEAFMPVHPDGTFRPDEPLTVAEALALLVRLLGFADYAEQQGGYPEGYLKAARELGLDQGLDEVDPHQPMRRWHMAVALVNTLGATTARLPGGSAPDPSQAGTSSWLATLWSRQFAALKESQPWVVHLFPSHGHSMEQVAAERHRPRTRPHAEPGVGGASGTPGSPDSPHDPDTPDMPDAPGTPEPAACAPGAPLALTGFFAKITAQVIAGCEEGIVLATAGDQHTIPFDGDLSCELPVAWVEIHDGEVVAQCAETLDAGRIVHGSVKEKGEDTLTLGDELEDEVDYPLVEHGVIVYDNAQEPQFREDGYDYVDISHQVELYLTPDGAVGCIVITAYVKP